MRSLVFIALIGLALAVPVPKAQSVESDIFFEAELPEDCYADSETYSQAQTEDDLQIDNITEEANDDCNDGPIEEEDLIDIEIDDLLPADIEDDLKYDNFPTYYEEEIDEDCIDEQPTEEPPIRSTPAPQVETTADGDCYSDDSEEVEEDYFELENEAEKDPLDTYDHSYVQLDQVFNNEFEKEQDGFEECVEY